VCDKRTLNTVILSITVLFLSTLFPIYVRTLAKVYDEPTHIAQPRYMMNQRFKIYGCYGGAGNSIPTNTEENTDTDSEDEEIDEEAVFRFFREPVA